MQAAIAKLLQKNEGLLNKAKQKLKELHNKYGTVDINIIKELIK